MTTSSSRRTSGPSGSRRSSGRPPRTWSATRGLTQRDVIDVDKILFESDYPHADTPWPHTQASVRELFRDVDQETTEKITYKNAEKLFKFPLTVPS